MNTEEMNKAKYCLTVIIVTLFSHCSVSQDSYIATDTSLNTGVKVLDGSAKDNAQFIRVNINSKIVRYTPDNLEEYGLKDGRSFHSFNINSNGVDMGYFFERLFKGRYNIYYLPDNMGSSTFYITPNDTIPLAGIPREKDQYVNFLVDYVRDCPRAVKNAAHIEMTKNGLVRFFMNYENCSESHMARFRYGINGGMTIVKFTPGKNSELLAEADYNVESGFFIGVFADSPMGRSKFSIRTEPTLYHYKSSNVFKVNDVTYDLVVNQLRLGVPILLRYTLLDKKTSPFVEGGAIYSGHLSGDNALFSYRSIGDDIFIDLAEKPGIPNHQVGFSVGAGMIAKYDSNCSFMFQLKYNKLYDIQNQRESLNVSEIMFGIGLLF